MKKDLKYFQNVWGIHVPASVREFTPDNYKRNFSGAQDAQPGLITTGSNGIPGYLTNFIDPEVIRVLTTPNDAAEIYGEVQKGSWTDKTATFVMIESTGEVASYNDWSNNGATGTNVNFPQRQSYHYQTVTQYGDHEVEVAAEARINYVSELDVASALVLTKFQNDTYFYGIAGLQNYGALNDPNLPASIVPITKAATGTVWDNATAEEIFSDVLKLVTNLITRSKGIINAKSPMTLAMSPNREVHLAKTNQYGINVYDLLSKNYPNMTIKTAIQFDTAGGSLMQLFPKTLDGKAVTYCAFTEKMRAHGFVRDLSATRQKKSQGTWGCIIRYPVAISSMLGI